MPSRFAVLCAAMIFAQLANAQWSGYSHDAQHTGESTIQSQPMNSIHWSTPVDTVLQGQSGPLYIHYGTPVITAGNTVLVPERTNTNGTYQINAFQGSTGAPLYTLNTTYTPPPHDWVPSFGGTLANANVYYYPGPGGTIYYRQSPDSGTGNSGQFAFYGMSNYLANQTTFNGNVFISTPITADRFGNIYFGFVVTGAVTLPGGPTLTSGLARITLTGAGSWTSAAALAPANSSLTISQIPLNCAPAISTSGTALYVGISNGGSSPGYLVEVNPTTLKPINQVELIDPYAGEPAELLDDSSASPTIGPDGDVYYGVFETYCCQNHDRGWLLHFNSTLTVSRIPGAFGWDTTATVVPKALVPSYTGSSSYLLLTKYNNYKETGGTGMNYVAITDPNTAMLDPITGVSVMNIASGPGGSLMEQLGPTSDAPPQGAVREWCINSAAIDINGRAAIVNSEDGTNYRWDFTTNSLSQRMKLTSGVGEAYTPTVIGPDGTIYAINDATLFAIGQ